MWWDSHTSEHPLRSVTLPQSFRKLFHSLVSNENLPVYLEDCLVGVYLSALNELKPHRDLFGVKYYGHPEHVFLIFSGSERCLAITPNCRRSEPTNNFLYQIQCSHQIAIELLPLANTYFCHTKTNSKYDEPSFTLSWRRGIPIKKMKKLYPKQFHNLCRKGQR